MIEPRDLTWEDKRDIWIPEWETETVTAMGQPWPEGIIVTRWERNLIGEKRYVDTKWYGPPDD